MPSRHRRMRYPVIILLAATAIPFLFGLVAARIARERVLPVAAIFVGAGLGGLLGAHLHYVLAHPELARPEPWVGVHVPGGILGVVAYFVILVTAMPRFAGVCDAAALTLGPGIALSRVACFLNGCCAPVRGAYVAASVILVVFACIQWLGVRHPGRLLLRTSGLYLV